LELPIPEGGGIIVLHGRNGAGKTKTLEAIDRLTSGRGDVSVRDGALKGAVKGFGATLTVARSATRRGTLEVESLEGRLSVADLVQPPVKDPAAADARRIKTLVGLSGAKADPKLFHPLVGGPEAFEAIMPLAEADDLVALAGKIKRDFEAEARKQEDAAKKAEIAAQAQREAIGELDLSEPIDSDAAYATLQEATKRHTELIERLGAADAAGDRALEARERLEAAEKAHDGPTVDETDKALTFAVAATDAAKNFLADAQHALDRAKAAHQAAVDTEEKAEVAHKAAHQHASAMAAWRKTLEAELPAAPEPAELEAATEQVTQARAVVAKLPAYQQAKQHEGKAIEQERLAGELAAKAEQLRDAAKGTDNVLSEAVGRLGTPLRVEAGRLVLDTGRGDTYLHDLSHGERWRLGLDIAVAIAGDRTLFTIPQEAWESLDPQNREEIARHVREKGITVLTAESTADDQVTAEVYEAEERAVELAEEQGRDG
jgi:energy-coupling factor transporter ATP-binding protein EcfA2